MVKHYTNQLCTKRFVSHCCAYLCVLLFALGCETNDEPASYAPTLTTNTATGLTRSGATFQGSVVANPNSENQQLEVGFFYSTSASLTGAGEVMANSSGDGSNYSATVSNLEPGQTYYYCIFARSGKAVSKGKTNSFDTEEATVPTLSVATGSGLTESTVSLTASVIDNGGVDPTVKGFIYTLYIENAGDPMLGEGETADASGSGNDFSASLSGLSANTSYLVRPYATNDAGTGYGESVIITTTPLMTPVVVADAASSPGAYAATVTASVTEDYGFTPTEYGFVYSSESNRPTVDNSQSVTADGNNTRFTGVLTGLAANTKYYYRAYAINEKGTGYSETLELTTDSEQVVSLTQATVTDLTSSSATVTVLKATTAGTTISEQGICYGQQANPDIDGNGTKLVDNSGSTTQVAASLTGLAENSTYHARAYAITRDGTFYSSDVIFTTEGTFTPSLDGMPEIYDLTETGAKIRHTIASNGGLAITEKGFVYSGTLSEPTLENASKLTSTDAGNDITASIDGLSGGTIYYIRSFATNAKGTNYSQIAEFTTAQHTAPQLTALNIYEIGDDNAMATSYISNYGGEGETITERGFVVAPKDWTETPSVGDGISTVFPSDATTDEFTLKMTGLWYNTLYCIRAYAKNSIGYGYSRALQFETRSSTTPEIGNLTCTEATYNSLTFTFDIINDGGAELTEHSLYWKLAYSSEEDKIQPGVREGNVVTATITGLEPDTEYQVLAIARNKNGHAGGGTFFRTAKLPPASGDNPLPGDHDHTSLPKLDYPSVSEVYATSAWVSSGINNNGNMEITEKGFLYAVDNGTELTMDNATKTVVTSESDSFSTKLTNLTGNTRYRVRAYAINAKGVGYSSERTFTTESSDKPAPGADDNPTPDANE